MGGQNFGGYNQIGAPQQGGMMDPGMSQQGQFNQPFQTPNQHHNMGMTSQQPGYMAQQPQPTQNFGQQYVLLLICQYHVCDRVCVNVCVGVSDFFCHGRFSIHVSFFFCF